MPVAKWLVMTRFAEDGLSVLTDLQMTKFAEDELATTNNVIFF